MLLIPLASLIPGKRMAMKGIEVETERKKKVHKREREKPTGQKP